MAMPEKYRQYGNELVELLKLRTMPVAVKMLEKRETPENALLPKRDLGKHLTLCQAFSLVRREGRSVAMFKEDYWCVWPVIALGLVECTKKCVDEVHDKMFIKDPALSRQVFENSFPRLEYGRYAGMLLSPLPKTEFIPDVILVYANPAVLRSMLWVIRCDTGSIADCTFEVEFSCVFATVPVLQTGKYRATFPDPGEYERAFAAEDEMIFSLPGSKAGELVAGLKAFEKMGFGYRQFNYVMRYDFARPRFYDDLFNMWGLDRGEIWPR